MKKIMFNDAYGLTQATIEGWKTNTRRAEFKEAEQKLLTEADEVFMDANDVVAVFDSGCNVRLSTRYKVGEVVAVAQSYETIRNCMTIGDPLLPEWTAASPGWNNKMFVKADLMPHQIRITGRKCERLQDISDEDCFKEGICFEPISAFDSYGVRHGIGMICLGKTPREAFAALIDKVSGRGTWVSNPWVVAYEYELVK